MRIATQHELSSAVLLETATQHELSSAISGEVLEYYEYLTTRVHALLAAVGDDAARRVLGVC